MAFRATACASPPASRSCEAAGCVVGDLFGDAWGRGPTGLLAAADAETHERLLGLTRARLQ
jgi:hypothetical protein